MTDASMPDQATESDQDIASSQQAQLHAPPNPGGSALLDANRSAGESTNPEAEAIDHPIATNFPSGTGARDAKTADASTVAGPFAADQEQSEKGKVDLQNNPNPPENNLSGNLPDTDPMKLPLDPNVNLPD